MSTVAINDEGVVVGGLAFVLFVLLFQSVRRTHRATH